MERAIRRQVVTQEMGHDRWSLWNLELASRGFWACERPSPSCRIKPVFLDQSFVGPIASIEGFAFDHLQELLGSY